MVIMSHNPTATTGHYSSFSPLLSTLSVSSHLLGFCSTHISCSPELTKGTFHFLINQALSDLSTPSSVIVHQ